MTHLCERPGCDNPIERRSQRFCSRRCGNLKSVEAECLQCGKPLQRTPYQVRHGTHLYCDERCYGDSLKLPVEQLTCKGCGASFPRPAGKPRAYCPTCFPRWRELDGLPRRKLRPCEGKDCPNEVYGIRRFCSDECRGKRTGDRSRPLLQRPCERCGTLIKIRPSRPTRRFCDMACTIGPEGGWKEITCELPGCRKTKKVHASRVGPHRGKYCCKAHYYKAKKIAGFRFKCRGCGKFTTVIPSRKGKARYCGRECYDAHRITPTHTCEAPGCTNTFQAAQWEEQHYCGLSCANRARAGFQWSTNTERDQRILALHELGRKSDVIARQLVGEGLVAYEIPASTVRSVIARGARHSHVVQERSATPARVS